MTLPMTYNSFFLIIYLILKNGQNLVYLKRCVNHRISKGLVYNVLFTYGAEEVLLDTYVSATSIWGYSSRVVSCG